MSDNVIYMRAWHITDPRLIAEEGDRMAAGEQCPHWVTLIGTNGQWRCLDRRSHSGEHAYALEAPP